MERLGDVAGNALGKYTSKISNGILKEKRNSKVGEREGVEKEGEEEEEEGKRREGRRGTGGERKTAK